MTKITETLDDIEKREMGIEVVELEILRNGSNYVMVGKVMSITQEKISVAFSSKDDSVLDYVLIPIEEILSIRIVPENEIHVIS